MNRTDAESRTDPRTGSYVDAKKQGRERRVHDRAECDGFAEVILEDAAFLFRGRVRDLSLSGCYIQSSARLVLPRGTAVELRITVNGQELQLPAQIMIVRQGAGAGFEFLKVEPEMQGRLSSLFRKLEDPLEAGGPNVRGNIVETNATAASTRDLWK